jgi:DNA-binding CsgD family transcriptional regulator
LPTALTSSQRCGAEALPAVLPASRRAQQLFAPQIAALSGRARQALLMVALEESGDLHVIEETLSTAGAATPGLQDLAAAERCGLVRVDESAGRVVFRHPLVRSAAVELSTSSERRRAHQVLATALAGQPDRQAWHLASASVGPDDKTAGLLASAAYHALGRGDAAGAVTALARAADLSQQAPDRARRLAEAAYIAGDVTGELRRAPQLLAKAMTADPDLSGTLQAAAASSLVLINGDGDVAAAHRLLVSAIEAGGHSYDARNAGLVDALWTLLRVCFFSGRPESWAPLHKALARLRPAAPRLLSLCASTYGDPARTAAAALPDLISAIRRLTAETDPAVIIRTSLAAGYVGWLPECREALWRVIRDGRRGGAVASAISACTLLGGNDVWAGLWDEADSLIGESLALCAAHGYDFMAGQMRYGQATLAAARGELDASRRLTDQMMRWAVPRGIRSEEVYARHVMALAALGLRDFEAAYQQVSAISQPGTIGSHSPVALWAALETAEAAARSGHRDEAAAHARAMREAGIGGLSPRFAAVEHAATALAETGDRAAQMFERALAVPGSELWVFDHARIQLLFGEQLRRDRAPARAREHLAAAFEVFRYLGARPWAERAAGELRAAGRADIEAGKARQSGIAGHGTLTAREREVALLAATGLSNKQIGERLFLSPRTVSDHLHNIYPKLGIVSRAALRDALGE